MQNMLRLLLVSALFFLLVVGETLASNITVYDGFDSSTYPSTVAWYNGTNTGDEDQEVEPYMVGAQIWDLEAFVLDDNSLSMIGGYNFRDGEAGNDSNNDEFNDGIFDSGDIFIDTDRDVEYGATAAANNVKNPDQNKVVSTTQRYGYDYVIDLDFEHLTYDVYNISGTGVELYTTYYDGYGTGDTFNEASNPWRYKEGGLAVASETGRSFQYRSGLTDAEAGYGLTGGAHNMVSGIDLSFISGFDKIFHFTMECGNDNLMGAAEATVPEPATMLLFGIGLVGSAGIGRRRFGNGS